MTRYKLENGEQVPLTPEEEAEREAEEQAADAERAAEEQLQLDFAYREGRAKMYRETMGDMSDEGVQQPDVNILADQLDDMYEYFETLRSSGTLPQGLLDKMDKRLAVKAAHPKPIT